VRTEFRVLGDVRVSVQGRDIDLGFQRQQCVLAVLLVEANRVVSVDDLVERAWGERAPRRARTALYSYLSRLRGVLAAAEDVDLVRRNGGYRLTVDERCVDLHHFRDLVGRARACPDDRTADSLLADALALWRGDAFNGLDSPWLGGVRDTAEHDRFAAELDHADIALRCGRHAGLLTELAGRAAARPLDERLAGQLMVALYRSGRQADAIGHYHHIRARLADDIGADPCPPLQRLYHQILAGDQDFDDPVEASRPAVPRQLPAAPAWFVGRRHELTALAAAVNRAAGVMAIAAITGAGGIGKTSIALHWAHQHVDEFPDGQLFVDLRGFTPGEEPLTPAAAIRGLLAGLGVGPERVPLELDAQIGLYRSKVADKRMLVVLDNAASAAQVAPLLPGSAACTVLVTSRDRLAGLVNTYGAQPVSVTGLPAVEARALLAARLGTARLTAEPQAVDDVIAHCAGLPLALSIMSGRAASQPELPLEDLAAELRDATARLAALDDGPSASMPAALARSYAALQPDQAVTFALLGLAPGPDISVPAAAALLDLPPARAGALLRALDRVSLVQQLVPGRYRLGDLARLFAADRARRDLPAADQVAALRRLADFYSRTALTCDRLPRPHRAPLDVVPATVGVPRAQARRSEFDRFADRHCSGCAV